MPIDVNDLLKKATDPIQTSDLSTGGLLTDEQLTAFINLVREEAAMTKDARLEMMNGPTKELSKINISGNVMLPHTEGTDPGTRQVPVFTKVDLASVAFMVPWEMTYESLEDSIERGGLENTVITSMARATANDIEQAAIKGDTTSADTMLAANQGWRKFAESGNVVTWDGTRISRANLLTAYNSMPTKWQAAPDMTFYFQNQVVNDWTASFGDRETSSGDMAVTSGNPPPFNGVPFVRTPYIPTTEIGTWGYEAGPTLSYGFMTPKSNLIMAWQRRITMETDKNIYTQKREYAIGLRVDWEFEEDDAVVLMLNVGLPS